ncbi:hypothetical protein [Aquimarina algiphila]|uniref:hypothetical protein n=1 Tax=Aquimarina algiphila TaxID=2047982 RepID=UPI00232CD022|nr:hypothetical protein [Aquimarina algiphila]
MKKIQVLLVILMFYSAHSIGQATISDVFVAGQKATIVASLTAEFGLKISRARLLTRLKDQEDLYNRKRRSITSPKLLFFKGVIQGVMSLINKKINSIEHNIAIQKVVSLRHGLSRHEVALKKEKKYFMKLQKENNFLNTGAVLSGGVGYNYTAFLKLLIRMMDIKSNILIIDKDVKGLMHASRIFAR